MIVLSLFDGCSCGRLALERAGIFVTRYFASEIDKHAIKVSRVKWPDIIHIGNVEKVSYKNGILYTENGDFPIKRIDALIGGSPCQGFSFAGKGLNFTDPRSKLFFEYERILKEIQAENPDVIFLLENVMMKIEHQRVINDRLGFYPIQINSNLVSAQNRDRLYWTNIGAVETGLFGGEWTSGISAPADKGVFLKDILENKVHRKYYVSPKAWRGVRIERECSGIFGVVNDEGILKEREKANCLDHNSHKGMDNHRQRPMVVHAFGETKKLRRLTPTEACRLQTVPDDYFFVNKKQIVSDTQIYKLLGNGWTIDVISHIFSHI